MHRRRRRLSLYVLHRWIGAVAALLVLLVATTGLILNHAADWSLDRQPVRLGAALDAYGIDVPAPEQGVRAGDHWISAADGSAYRDTVRLERCGALIGVAVSGEWTLIVGDEAALLIDGEGRLVERSDRSGWPSPITRVAATDAGFVLTTPAADFFSGPELLGWQPYATASPRRVAPVEALPSGLSAQIRDDARARLLNWERVLLDLHSGRLPGRAGVYIADLLALALIALALSGLWMWIRHLRRRRSHRAHR